MLNRWWKKQHRILEDVMDAGAGPRVLISAVDRAFRKGDNLKHNNQAEAVEMARAFHELGYRADVVNWDHAGAIDYDRYDLLFGSGLPLDRAFLRDGARLPRAIFYSCGAHGPVADAASLERLLAVYRDRGAWLPGSARMSGGGFNLMPLCAGVVVLGNEVTAGPFRACTDRPVIALPMFFHQVAESAEILAARDLAQARRHFIWFAGAGLVHKGLDLALLAFARHPDLHLHVYGALEHEAGFIRAFRPELRELPNVHVEGFLPIGSPGFRAALAQSAFMIQPSCAEACSTSVLNVCGNGGNIPLITRQCGIDPADVALTIEDTTVEATEAALMAAAALGDDELERRLQRSAAFFRREHSRDRFRLRLKQAIQTILAGAPS